MLLSRPDAMAAFTSAQQELAFLESQRFSPDAVAGVQEAKLKALWARAVRTPYYESLAGTSPEQFHLLPITPKAVVKSRPELFRVEDGEEPLKYYETSGTTGAPTSTPRVAADIVWNTISVASGWKRVLRPEDRVIMLLPSDLAPIGDLVSNVCEYLGVCLVRCYPFAMGICDWDRIQQVFERYQPTCLFASPGVIIQFMRTLKQRGKFESARQSVTKLMLMGEVLTPSLRQMLAQTWEAQAYDASYGSTETGTIATTCEHGHLHIITHSYVLEIEASDGLVPLAPDQKGDLVVTPLNNYARPMLRYGMGDVVQVYSPDLCACGSAQPVLRVMGRKAETVEIQGVPLDVGTVERVIYAAPGITGYLIEVTTSGNRARLLLEKDIDFPEDDGAIRTAWLHQEFSAIGINWDEVLLLSQLPAITKSSAGQKNWKKTNIRVVPDDASALR